MSFEKDITEIKVLAEKDIFHPATPGDVNDRPVHKMKMAFEANKAEYLKNPYNCPFCKSPLPANEDHLVGEAPHYFQDILCKNCGGHWFEYYVLVNIDIPEEDE